MKHILFMNKLNNPKQHNTVTDYINLLKRNYLRHYDSEYHTNDNNKLISKQKSQNIPLNQQFFMANKTKRINMNNIYKHENYQSCDPIIIRSLGGGEDFYSSIKPVNPNHYKTLADKKPQLLKMSTAQIQQIIENKRKNIMSLVYDSVQISLQSKDVLLKANKSSSQKSKQKRSVSKIVVEEKQISNLNIPGLKLPDINKRLQQGKQDNLEESLNNFGRLQQSLRMTEEEKGLNRNMTQQIKNLNIKKQINIYKKRYQQNEKLIQTFYQYEKLMHIKQQKALKDWRQRNNKQKNDQKLIINYQNHKIPSKKQLAIQQELINLEKQQQNIIDTLNKPDQVIVAELEKQQFKNNYFNSTNFNHTSTSPQHIKNRKKKNSLQLLNNNFKQLTVYQKKISAYRDFIFQMNFIYGKYDPLILKDDINTNKSQLKYKVFIGKGNNSLLIKGLFKRRYWWTFQEDIKNCNFVWTQLKINSYYDLEVQDKQTNQQNQQKQIQFQNKNLLKFSVSKSPKKQISDYNITNKKSKQKIPKPDVPRGNNKIFSQKDALIYKKFTLISQDSNKFQDFQHRCKYIDKKLITINSEIRYNYRVHNHLQCNYFLGNKKALFYNLRQYYQLNNKNVFDIVPLTFHIKHGTQDRQYKSFLKYYKKREQMLKSKDNSLNQGKSKKKKILKNIWIVKPGQNSNRGRGITVIDQIYQLNKILRKPQKHPNGIQKTFIVQAYIQKPLLYNKRKFDIRHYMLITTLYGKMRGYWYSQGYIRTSSYEFDLEDIQNPLIHLTNDAIQKYGNNYGKYEEGNKISYAEFQKYLDLQMPDKKYNFYQMAYPKMKNIAKDAIRSTCIRLDPKKLEHNFQIFGLDYMIDQDFNVWLIEVNTNPCLQISSNLLGRIIPTMVQHSFRLSLDILFPPYAQYPNTQKHLAPQNVLESLKYELIFDQYTDIKQLEILYANKIKLDCGQIDEEQQVYLDEGKQFNHDQIK